MLREDIVKDDNGYTAVFAEQSASASQMAAATVLDAISGRSMRGHAGAHVGSSQVAEVTGERMPTNMLTTITLLKTEQLGHD